MKIGPEFWKRNSHGDKACSRGCETRLKGPGEAVQGSVCGGSEFDIIYILQYVVDIFEGVLRRFLIVPISFL